MLRCNWATCCTCHSASSWRDGIEKAVNAESDQQHLGTGPGDHGSRKGAATAQQQYQAAVGGEQQRNREKYGGRQPISKPGHSYSIDAGLINELSPSQVVPARKRRNWPMLNVNCPEYRRLILAYTVTNRSPRKHARKNSRISNGSDRGKPQWISSAFHSVRSRTHWLFFEVNRDGTELRWHGSQQICLTGPTYGQGTRIRGKARHR